MIRNTLIGLSLALLATAGTLDAQPGGRLRDLIAKRMGDSRTDAPQSQPGETIAYGSDAAQQLSFWPAQGASGRTPLVLFVHGGGWSRGSRDNAARGWKQVHFPARGYAFASIDYRLVPQVTVEEQADDIAAAVRALVDRADSLGIDRHRIVLMGHSAGAHLVALVGTDERYLKGAGLSFADIAGVVPVDGAAYDVSAQMRDGPAIMQSTYLAAFGEDAARQRALSPTLQAIAPNAPAFLLLHVGRPDGTRQAQALEAALQAAGTAVERHLFEGEGLRGHMQINRQLGDPVYPATPVVDAWLDKVFRR